MRARKFCATVCFAGGLVVGTEAVAQSGDLVQGPSSSFANTSTLAFPSTFGVPTAVAPRAGTKFVGATYANPRGGVSGSGGDGDIVAGYAFGNPLNSVSLTFGVAFTGIEPFGDAGSFSLSASRLLRVGERSATFIGASASNLGAWGVNALRSEMFGAYVSHLVGVQAGDIEIPMQFTVGYGADTTRQKDGSGELDDGAFVGVGIGVTPSISVSLSATRTQLNAGTTLSIPNTRVSATLGALDVTNSTNRRQTSFSVGFSF